jgi:hypothetical protein
MTKDESVMLLHYALDNYPGVKMNDETFNQTVDTWQREFNDKTKEIVIYGFQQARIESPDFLPSIPKIQAAIRMIEMRAKQKSPEDEFRDSHCGKSKEEWQQMKEWESSREGAEKIRQYKQRLSKLF